MSDRVSRYWDEHHSNDEPSAKGTSETIHFHVAKTIEPFPNGRWRWDVTMRWYVDRIRFPLPLGSLTRGVQPPRLLMEGFPLTCFDLVTVPSFRFRDWMRNRSNIEWQPGEPLSLCLCHSQCLEFNLISIYSSVQIKVPSRDYKKVYSFLREHSIQQSAYLGAIWKGKRDPRRMGYYEMGMYHRDHVNF